MSQLKIGYIALALCSPMLFAERAWADRACGGVRLPDKVEAFGKTLQLNGAGVRRATFLNVHVYVAGLYVPEPTKDVARILAESQTKELALHFVRDVSRKEMMDAIREGIDNNAGSKKGAAESHMQSFERLLPELRAGTRLILAYDPSRGLEVREGDKLLGVEKDLDFAQLLFRVWLGAKPPDSKLKAGLLGAKCE